MAQYDLIGLDPRGTGSAILWDVTKASGIRESQALSKMITSLGNFSLGARPATRPENETGSVFDFLDSRSAAKDMEIIRRAPPFS
jgi:hypothetical protein